MKNRLAVTILCMFLTAGCYVSTSIEADKQYLPADFSAPVLVIAVQDRVGMYEAHLLKLEEAAVAAFAEKGIESISLGEATGQAYSANASELLKEKDYKALLNIVILSWGSKTEILQDPVETRVGSTDTGPDSGSSFFPPNDPRSMETVPGPEASFKMVEMNGSVMDLRNNRQIWSGRVDSRPAVVGRSFIYKNFNRKLELDDLANRCFRKLAKELARAWPVDSET